MPEPSRSWWQRAMAAIGFGSKEPAPTREEQPTRPASRFPGSSATIQDLCSVTEDVPIVTAEELLRSGLLPGLRLVDPDDPSELVQRRTYAADVEGIGEITLTTIAGEVVGISVTITTITTAELAAHVEQLVGQPFHVIMISRSLVSEGSLISIHGGAEHPELVGTRQPDSIDAFLAKRSGADA